MSRLDKKMDGADIMAFVAERLRKQDDLKMLESILGKEGPTNGTMVKNGKRIIWEDVDAYQVETEYDETNWGEDGEG